MGLLFSKIWALFGSEGRSRVTIYDMFVLNFNYYYDSTLLMESLYMYLISIVLIYKANNKKSGVVMGFKMSLLMSSEVWMFMLI